MRLSELMKINETIKPDDIAPRDLMEEFAFTFFLLALIAWVVVR